MLAKYRLHVNDILSYIANRVQARASRETVMVEVQKEFSPQVLFPIDRDIMLDLIGVLYDMAYYNINKEHYKE